MFSTGTPILSNRLIYVHDVSYSGMTRLLYSFLFWVGKRVWTSSQVTLILVLPYGSVNNRNIMHTHLVAASTYCYKHIIFYLFTVICAMDG